MKILTTLFAILLILLTGCAKPLTLAQREQQTQDKYQSVDDILKEAPSMAYIRLLATSPEVKEQIKVSREHRSNQTIAMPVLGKLSGMTSIAGGLGFGLLMDFANWGSKENTLARTQKYNILNMQYDPAVLSYLKSDDEYNAMFSAQESRFMQYFKNLGVRCVIIFYSDDMKYAFAETYHKPNRFRYRTYECAQEGVRYVWSILSTRSTIGSETWLQFVKATANDGDNVVNRTNRSVTPFLQFELRDEFEPLLQGTYRVYGGHDKHDDFRWKLVLYTPSNDTIEVPPIELDEATAKHAHAVIENRIDALRKQNNGKTAVLSE